MLTVRPAVPADRPAVLSLLHRRMDRRIPPAVWSRILSDPWGCGAPFGIVADADGSVAGFLGTIHARPPDGRPRVNLTSWYIHRDYRGLGLGGRMLAAALADPVVTVTAFSANPAAQRLMHKAKFRRLDDRRLVWNGDGDVRGLANIRSGHIRSEHIQNGQGTISRYLSPATRRVWADHAGLNLSAFCFESADGPCCILYHVKRKGADVAWHEVLFCDAPAVLARHAKAVAAALLPGYGPAVLSVDSRFAPAARPDRVDHIDHPRLVRPGRGAHGPVDCLAMDCLAMDCLAVDFLAVDFLYSEIVLLDLKLY